MQPIWSRVSLKSPLPWIGAALLFLLALPAWQSPLMDPDLWWLMWGGKEMLAGHFPRMNAFSWTAPEYPWILHEPLVALSYAAVGVEYIGLLRGLVVSAGVLLLAHLAWRPRSAWATVFALTWVTPLLAFGRTERALSWGNLMLAGTVTLLFVVRGRWRLPAAAVLVGLWANVHGSFMVGVFLVLVTDWRWGLAAAALTLLNPNGVALWKLVFAAAGMSPDARGFAHAYIDEWLPVDPTRPDHLLRIACFAVAGVLVGTGKEWRPKLLWGFTTVLALWHWRYCDIVGITLLPFVARRLEVWLPQRPAGHPGWVLGPALVVLALVSPRAEVDATRFPPDLPAAIPPGARLWNDDQLGGWLGYHGVKVFWDGRNNYPIEVLRDGLQIHYCWEGWEDTLARRQVDVVVTRDTRKQERLLAAGWHPTYSAGTLRVLIHPSAGAGRQSESPKP